MLSPRSIQRAMPRAPACSSARGNDRKSGTTQRSEAFRQAVKICLPELTPNLHGCAELGPPADLFGGEDRQDGRARGEERRRQELAAPAAARGEPDAGARPFVEPSAVAKR